ncbi:MAG: hypothetical protein GF398_07650 [Chitinivibrionales bacterium]|nr:hypothetical protein [Chitinivibrionales bacterium]
MTPHADLLAGGDLVVDAQGYLIRDVQDGMQVTPTFLLDLGIVEWVNIHVGYAGGITLGFKARILGETKSFLPSLAVGTHNIISHKETGYFKVDTSLADINNEFYLAISKGVAAIKTRFHIGMQTIPTTEKEYFNPFVAVEKYYGMGIYTSLEFHRRHEELVFSLFADWRILRRKLEFSAGLIHLGGLLFDQNSEFRFKLASDKQISFVRPGIWIGLRYKGSLGFGKKGGFSSIEDHVREQEEELLYLKKELDSLKLLLGKSARALSEIDSTLSSVTASSPNERERIKTVLLEKIIALRSLYQSDHFEPERVKQLVTEVANYRERALGPLQELLLDKAEDRYIRLLSAMLLGEIRNKAASDVLLTVLSRESDPGIRIEILIALGKMRDTQAMYMMEQLANDADDAVALTAQEVLFKLEKETGARISPNLDMRDIALPSPVSLSEAKIPIADSSAGTPDTAAAIAMPDTVANSKPAPVPQDSINMLSEPELEDTLSQATDSIPPELESAATGDTTASPPPEPAESGIDKDVLQNTDAAEAAVPESEAVAESSSDIENESESDGEEEQKKKPSRKDRKSRKTRRRRKEAEPEVW